MKCPITRCPPGGGPVSFDERDLDAVLSGEPTDIPVVLRPVADVLAALQAAPTPAELGGQAVIMAEFRALAEFRAAGLAQNGRARDTAQTLVRPGQHQCRRRVPGADTGAVRAAGASRAQ